MPSPVMEYNLAPVAVALYHPAADLMVCGVGDSKITDTSTRSNLPYGLQRSLFPNANIVARAFRATGANSGVYWGATVTQGGGSYTRTDPQSTAANVGQQCPTAAQGVGGTAVAAGSVYATNNSPSPNPVSCYVYNGNQFWGAGNDWQGAPKDLTTYPGGDWTSGVPVTARVAYYANAAGNPTGVTVGGRGSTAVTNTPSDLSANPGTVQYFDAACGSGAGVPFAAYHVSRTSSPDYDESNKNTTILGGVIYRTDGGGARLPGIGIMDIGIGGHTTTSLLGALGGGGAATSVSARVVEWFNAISLGMRTLFIVDIGQNAATNETSELNAGTVTTYKANVLAIVNQLRAISPNCLILLCNSYRTGYTAVNNATKGLALLQVAQENNCSYLDVYTLAGSFGTPAQHPWTGYDAADAIHPLENGAVDWGAAIAAYLKGTYDRMNGTAGVSGTNPTKPRTYGVR